MRFGVVLCFDFIKEFFWVSRKFEFECEVEDIVEFVYEVEEIGNFFFDLVFVIEDVGIILLEFFYFGEIVECIVGFVMVEDIEIGKVEGKFFVIVFFVMEYYGVGWVVYGFEIELFFVYVKKEYVFFVMC